MIAEILLIVLSGVAAVFDLEYRKIPNLVIATGIFCGLFFMPGAKDNFNPVYWYSICISFWNVSAYGYGRSQIMDGNCSICGIFP